MRETGREGRAFRFLGRVVGGWVTVRAAVILVPLYWTAANRPAGIQTVGRMSPAGALLAAAAPIASPTAAPARMIGALRSNRTVPPGIAVPSVAAGASPKSEGWTSGMADALLAQSLAFTHANALPHRLDLAAFEPGRGLMPPAGEVPVGTPAGNAAAAARWSATGWILWRPEGRPALARGGQLGGSQAGARLDYAAGATPLGEATAYGRASAALGSPHQGEGALGIALRPFRRVPVSIAIERRQRISDGGRSAFALYAAAGVGPRSIGPDLELEGYGQGGIVGFARGDGFVDGKLSVSRRLTPPGDPLDLGVGGSLSGGAQPGAARLDVGPEVRMRLPIGQGRVRIGAEWRERVGGDARPASGPALTLIGTF